MTATRPIDRFVVDWDHPADTEPSGTSRDARTGALRPLRHELAEVHDHLLAQGRLLDDEGAYAAGVRDALAEVRTCIIDLTVHGNTGRQVRL